MINFSYASCYKEINIFASLLFQLVFFDRMGRNPIFVFHEIVFTNEE